MVVPRHRPRVIGIRAFEPVELARVDPPPSGRRELVAEKCVQHFMKDDVSYEILRHEGLIEMGVNANEVFF